MLIMSVFDLMGSAAYSLTTLPIPKGKWSDTLLAGYLCNAWTFLILLAPLLILLLTKEYFIEGSKGSDATCTAQGFFIQMGTIAAFINVSLAVYFYWVIKLSWTETKIRKFRLWLFLSPITVGLIFAFAGIPFYDMVWLFFVVLLCHVYCFFLLSFAFLFFYRLGIRHQKCPTARVAFSLVQQQRCMVAWNTHRHFDYCYHMYHGINLLGCLQGELSSPSFSCISRRLDSQLLYLSTKNRQRRRLGGTPGVTFETQWPPWCFGNQSGTFFHFISHGRHIWHCNTFGQRETSHRMASLFLHQQWFPCKVFGMLSSSFA